MSMSNFFLSFNSFFCHYFCDHSSFLHLIFAHYDLKKIFRSFFLKKFSIFFSILLPAFCSLLLDWIENEKNQNDDGLVMPFSPVMRPSQMSSNQLKNSNSFMDAFMQHLKANGRQIDTSPPPSVATTTTTTTKLETKLPMEPKQQQQQQSQPQPQLKTPKQPKERKPRQQTKKPREPSTVKKPRRKKGSNCTTIGLHIQIRDPKTEPNQTSDFESNKVTYPFTSDGIEAIDGTSNMISNTATENYLPVSTSSSCELGTGAYTYYNMDKTENEPGEQYLFEPEPIYHVQPMAILTPNECGNGSTTIINNSNINVTSDGYQIQAPMRPYNMYTEQKGNGHPILSHFNVAHTNVNNSSVVCDPLHNWRAGNEIM